MGLDERIAKAKERRRLKKEKQERKRKQKKGEVEEEYSPATKYRRCRNPRCQFKKRFGEAYEWYIFSIKHKKIITISGWEYHKDSGKMMESEYNITFEIDEANIRNLVCPFCFYIGEVVTEKELKWDWQKDVPTIEMENWFKTEWINPRLLTTLDTKPPPKRNRSRFKDEWTWCLSDSDVDEIELAEHRYQVPLDCSPDLCDFRGKCCFEGDSRGFRCRLAMRMNGEKPVYEKRKVRGGRRDVRTKGERLQIAKKAKARVRLRRLRNG